MVLVLLLASLACVVSKPVAPIPESSPSPTLVPATEVPAMLVQPSPESALLEPEKNPTPAPIPAPNTSPLSAASPHHIPGDSIELDEIHMFDGNNGWAISGAEVLTTSDGARSWHEVTPPQDLPSGSQIQIQGASLDQQNAWAVFSIDNQIPSEAVVWYTNDGGLTWRASAPLNHEAYGDQVWAEFSALDSMHVWLVMRGVYAGAGIHYAAQFFRTTDGGLTWLPLIGDVGVDYTGLVFADSNHGMITWQTTGAYAPSPPEYAMTSDGAVNWDNRELPAPVNAPDLFDTSPYCEPFQPHIFSDHSIRLLVGCFDVYSPPHIFSSYLYVSNDDGSTWTGTLLPDKVLASNDTLLFFNKNDVILLGRDIYRSVDGGQNWDHVKSVNWDGQFSFIDPQSGWAIARAGNERALVKTSDGGNSWSLMHPIIGR